MGGVRHFTYYATEATLSFLTKRQVRMWFLIDRDEHSDDEVVRMEQRLRDKAKVLILQRREIENYLVSSPAIAKFIAQKKLSSVTRANDTLPTERNVEIAIAEVADSLKQVAIAKRVAKEVCKPIYPSRDWTSEPGDEMAITARIVEEAKAAIEQLQQMIDGVQRVYDEHAAGVSGSWQATKTSIVPGDLLLDGVFSKFALRFHKERDGVRLAALMTESEIDGEIIRLIREVTA